MCSLHESPVSLDKGHTSNNEEPKWECLEISTLVVKTHSEFSYSSMNTRVNARVVVAESHNNLDSLSKDSNAKLLKTPRQKLQIAVQWFESRDCSVCRVNSGKHRLEKESTTVISRKRAKTSALEIVETWFLKAFRSPIFLCPCKRVPSAIVCSLVHFLSFHNQKGLLTRSSQS